MPKKLSPADRLIAARASAGITPAEAARRLDCTLNNYLQYEKGRRRLTLEQAHKIATALGLDPADVDPRLASTRDA